VKCTVSINGSGGFVLPELGAQILIPSWHIVSHVAKDTACSRRYSCSNRSSLAAEGSATEDIRIEKVEGRRKERGKKNKKAKCQW
jgi:hypothetical protein